MPRRGLRVIVATSLLLWASACSGDDDADDAPDDLGLPAGVAFAPLDADLDVIVDGFEIPWSIEVLGEDEYLVSERTGGLYHVRDGEAVYEPQNQHFFLENPAIASATPSRARPAA